MNRNKNKKKENFEPIPKEIESLQTEQVEHDLTQLNYHVQESLSELLGLLMNLNNIDRQLNLKTFQLYLKKVVSTTENLHKMLDGLTKKINVELLQTNDQIHNPIFNSLSSVPSINLKNISMDFMKQLTEGLNK